MRDCWSDTLDVEVTEESGYPCLHLSGEGERAGAGRFTRIAEALVDAGHTQLILDARGIRFLDPECAATIEALRQRLEEEGGALVIVDRCQPVERALKLMGLDLVTHVVPSLSQAVCCLES